MYEELISELREEAEWAKANEWETPIMLSDHLKQAADAIEELSREVDIDNAAMTAMDAAMPRWIPVTEQCPEKSGDYLVFDDCRNLYVNEWHCLLKKWQYDDSRITHWQPLPEPPKEGE